MIFENEDREREIERQKKTYTIQTIFTIGYVCLDDIDFGIVFDRTL